MLVAEMSTVMFTIAIVTLLIGATYLTGIAEIEEYVKKDDLD